MMSHSNNKLKSYFVNVVLIACSIIISIGSLELVLRLFPMTSGRYTLSTKIWFSRYWNPTNKYRYRDISPSWDGKRKKVAFLGDSFTAGHGITSPEDRFSNLVTKKLDKKIQGYNLGVCGADTSMEYKNLIDFPYRPDVIIWQYFANDIEHAAAKKGVKFVMRDGSKRKNKITKWLNDNSLLFNYIKVNTDNFADEYVDYLKKSFNNNEVWTEHQNDINMIINFSKTNNIPMLVILFPFLGIDPNESNFYMNQMISFLNKNNITTLDVRADIASLPLSKCIVNKSDPHPSVLLHKKVAERIYEWFVQCGQLESQSLQN